jgi:hypothetical protein
MKCHAPFLITLAFLFSLPLNTLAQTAPAARGIAKELAEVLGQRSARELAEAGGETAVREVVEKAAKEGGEQLAREVAVYGQRYGAQALKAFGEAPVAMTQAMQKVPAELTESAMRAAAREPQAIAQLTSKIGEDALIVAAKHPGVGVNIASKLGPEGCAIARQLSTPEAIRLARLGDDIARLPAAEKAGILSRIGRAPGKVIDYLEKHPGVLSSAATVTAAYLAIDALLGDAASPGFLERMADKFHGTVSVVLVAVAALIAARALWWWKRGRRIGVQTAKS